MTDVDVFLSHHGVKGMKCGVRKEDRGSPDNSLEVASAIIKVDKQLATEAKNPPPWKYFGFTKKQIAVGATILLGVGVTTALCVKYGKTPLSDALEITDQSVRFGRALFDADGALSAFDRMAGYQNNLSDIHLPKGTTFQRLSSTIETNLNNGAYAVYTAKDKATYASQWGGMKQGEYIHSIEALSDLKAPSLANRIEAIINVLDKPDPVYKGYKSVREGLASEHLNNKEKAYILSAPADELAKVFYVNKLSGGDWKQGLGQVVMNELRTRGYSFMIDDEDSNDFADSASVLLNKNNFKLAKGRTLSPTEIKQIVDDYKRLLSL